MTDQGAPRSPKQNYISTKKGLKLVEGHFFCFCSVSENKV